jgi:hypothetical protein
MYPSLRLLPCFLDSRAQLPLSPSSASHRFSLRQHTDLQRFSFRRLASTEEGRTFSPSTASVGFASAFMYVRFVRFIEEEGALRRVMMLVSVAEWEL